MQLFWIIHWILRTTNGLLRFLVWKSSLVVFVVEMCNFSRKKNLKLKLKWISKQFKNVFLFLYYLWLCGSKSRWKKMSKEMQFNFLMPNDVINFTSTIEPPTNYDRCLNEKLQVILTMICSFIAPPIGLCTVHWVFPKDLSRKILNIFAQELCYSIRFN